MTTLTAWRFPSAEGVVEAERRLGLLPQRERDAVLDAAIVSWPEDAARPTSRDAAGLGAGVLGEGFWGLLFGVVLFAPLIGAAVGPDPVSAPVVDAPDAGIDARFVATVREEMEPGASALFMISSESVLDRVQEALSDVPMTLIHTELSDDQEAVLRRVFGD